MVVIFAVFFLSRETNRGFWRYIAFFLVILSRQNTCLPVFLVVSCETPGIFSVLCNFFDCRLVFIYFCCVFGLMWLIINGFCCFFLVSRETCRFHSRFLLFCGNFCSLCCVFLFRLVYLGLFFGIKWILLRFCF